MTDWNASLVFYDDMLVDKPNDVEVIYSRAVTLDNLRRFDEAMQGYDHALALNPQHASSAYNAGLLLYERDRFDEAILRFDYVLNLDPKHVGALNNRGIVYQALQQQARALVDFERAIAAEPSNQTAHWNAACSLLALGDFARGWVEHEWRWKTEHFAKAARQFPKPQWQGESLVGKTIALWPEQGIGDTFQFCRYALVVKAMGARVQLVCSPLQYALFSDSFTVSGIDLVVDGSVAPPFDFHCPLMSLPLLCKTDNVKKIPAQIPYLFASESRAKHWLNRIQSAAIAPEAKRIGLVWAGGGGFKADERRSLFLRDFECLVAIPNTQFFSLQKGESNAQLQALQNEGWRGPKIIDWTNDWMDWADTAGMIANLDLVITCDTSVAHLAGAMGKPTWILSRFNGCWRWMVNRDDSPWYPSVRLFRQTQFGDWDSVIFEVAKALLGLTHEKQT
jgi:tetratricopeptide (TPR) repeat protein